MEKLPIYSKQIIEIADAFFANPTKEVSLLVSEYVSKCHKSERTVWRWVKKAQEYNKIRLQKQEDAKDEVLISKAKELLESAILTRNESLEILSLIAKGGARKVPTELIEKKDGSVEYKKYCLEYPADGDRTRAIQQLAKMQGWEEPKKIDITQNKVQNEESDYNLDNIPTELILNLSEQIMRNRSKKLNGN